MRKLMVAIGTLGCLFVLLSGVAAQDDASTPPVDGTPVVVQTDDPAPGTQIVWSDEEDTPIAGATVERIIRDQDEFVDIDEEARSDDIEYIILVVRVENLGSRGAIDVVDLDFSLHDSDGYLWGASVVPIRDAVEASPLPDEGVSLPDGESVTFALVYEVEAGQELAHLFWQPDSGRLITLASLAGQ